MTFENWFNWFKQNESHFDHLNWSEGFLLNDQEKHAIQKSIQEFQRGEYSEGHSFKRFAEQLGDPVYTQTIQLFIREEQRHAMVLRRFMLLNSIPPIRKSWTDTVFRKLRKLSNIENTIRVLMTAELIAAIYYKALEKATRSSLLQNICKQILADETMHLRFQTQTLRICYEKRSLPGRILTRLIHRFLMMGTIVVVWMGHKSVLKRGGYSFGRWGYETMKEYEYYAVQIRGHRKLQIPSPDSSVQAIHNKI